MSQLPKRRSARSLPDVLENIKDPSRWIETAGLIRIMTDNPSLRGMTYGYVAEYAFSLYLDNLGIREHFKEDDHKKTKSDRTFVHKGRRFTIQLKSLQTNTVQETSPGQFKAKVQNDASDRRKIKLPNGKVVETTCYQVGEYDILGVSLQPFAGDWEFAFKKNKDLKRSVSDKYSKTIRKYLLATTEDISFPLSQDWTSDLLSLLDDPDLGQAVKEN
jgi:hypothetical protein